MCLQVTFLLNNDFRRNIPLVVKYIDDTELKNKNPSYFSELQPGVFAYFITCTTGEALIGLSFGTDNNNLSFGWQMLITGHSTDVKVRNCGWAAEWSEWRNL